MPAHSRLVFCIAGLVLVVLACMAAGCTSSQTPPAPSLPPAATPSGNSIAIKNFAFDPSALTVKSGTSVTWTNLDSAPHTLLSDTGSPVPFSSDTLSTGKSYSVTFSQPGTYAYHCSIHPSMRGTVVVQG